MTKRDRQLHKSVAEVSTAFFNDKILCYSKSVNCICDIRTGGLKWVVNSIKGA